MPFDLHNLLALPLTPCIRIRVGPRPDDVVEVSSIAWEESKPQFIEFCKSLPGIDEGPSWRQLKVHTGGNGLLARLLIALGEFAGVWTMFPSVSSVPELWKDMHPMILRGSVAKKSRVPKPSAGDLERDTKPCGVCERLMGPADSHYHDLVASPDERICVECFQDGKDPDDVAEKPRPKTKRASENDEEGETPQPDQDALTAYLRQFQG